MDAAAAWARESGVDGFVAVGGGSAIDTAKAMSLLSTNDGTIHDYLNAPIGPGTVPTRPLAPLIAIPTTAGTGSESTPVCVLDVLSLRLKAGISHPSLRPRLAILDPSVTLTMPRDVTAASGMDVLCHALESLTARPFDARERRAPGARTDYNGANPISDGWALRALELLGRWFRRAVDAPSDLEAREGMMLAATYAGIGFGNAGVHLPHACAYPIAGMVRDYRPVGYPGDEPMVPHGQSVVATAPAAFRFTFDTDPERHLQAAALLAGSTADGRRGPDPKRPARRDHRPVPPRRGPERDRRLRLRPGRHRRPRRRGQPPAATTGDQPAGRHRARPRRPVCGLDDQLVGASGRAATSCRAARAAAPPPVPLSPERAIARCRAPTASRPGRRT